MIIIRFGIVFDVFSLYSSLFWSWPIFCLVIRRVLHYTAHSGCVGCVRLTKGFSLQNLTIPRLTFWGIAFGRRTECFAPPKPYLSWPPFAEIGLFYRFISMVYTVHLFSNAFEQCAFHLDNISKRRQWAIALDTSQIARNVRLNEWNNLQIPNNLQ